MSGLAVEPSAIGRPNFHVSVTHAEARPPRDTAFPQSWKRRSTLPPFLFFMSMVHGPHKKRLKKISRSTSILDVMPRARGDAALVC